MAFSRWRTFQKTLLASTRWEREMSEEMQFHLEQRTEDLVRSGVSRPEAIRRARMEFGGVEVYKEDCSEARGLRWVDELHRDIRHAVRTLRKSPGLASVAIISLALGIGANTAIFTLINNLILKSLPVRGPRELVLLGDPEATYRGGQFSYRAYTGLRDRNHVLAGLAARVLSGVSIGKPGSSEWIPGEYVSGNYFSVLGVNASLGRTIAPEDDLYPGNRVAVLSDGFWRRRYGRDPQVLGRAILILGRPFTIIGVTPPDFFGVEVGRSPDVRLPLVTCPDVMEADRSFAHGPTWEEVQLFGRLRPNVPRQQAGASLAALFQQMRQEQAEVVKWTSDEPRRRFLERRLVLSPGPNGYPALRGWYHRPLLILMGVVGLVMVIACTNFSGLLLARAAARRREIALRLALGAGRRDLARQLLTESTLLALGGGVVGVFLAWWGCGAILASIGGFDFGSVRIAPDLRVLAFTLALALLAGILFGLAPVWQSAGTKLVDAIKEQGGSVLGGQRQFSARRALVVSQIALSVVLLAAAGLLVRTFRNLLNLDLGMDQQHVVEVSLWDPQFSALPQARWGQVFRTALARLEALPGVQSAAVSKAFALWPGPPQHVTVEGARPDSVSRISAQVQSASYRYFETLGMTLVRGRMWTAHEDLEAPRCAVVNSTFARRAFGSLDPVGRRVRVGMWRGPERELEIIGVVKDSKVWRLRDDTPPALFHPPANWANIGRVYVRTEGDPNQMAAVVRRELYSVEPKLGETTARSLAREVEVTIGPDRLSAWLAGLFGLLASLLTAIGLYGVIAYSVACRIPEIGIRMALGAGRGQVLQLVLRDVAVLVGIGLAFGLPAALALTRLTRSLLYGVEPNDPVTLAVAILLMTVLAALAGYLPARRAMAVDPMIALRCE